MEHIVIKIENLSKMYKLYQKQSDRMKEALSIIKKVYHNDFHALVNINLELHSGEAIGIIGTNGSGKSTLLKIICGVLTPTNGTVDINGRIAALLELGAGFNPDYSGMENIFLNGTIMGFSKEEMQDKVDEILAFADIGEFINQPVKTYSSGMFARLAFAVSINVNPDILIVDEALSVGDIRFQQKCFRKMEEIKKNKTVLMVSHDLSAISKFCDKVLWIEKGEMRAFGDPVDIIKEYQAYLVESKLTKALTKSTSNDKELCSEYRVDNILEKLQSYGNKDSEIIGVGLFKQDSNEKLYYVRGGEIVKFVFRILNNKPLERGILGITLFDRLGNNIFGINSFYSNDNIDSEIGTFLYECNFKMPELNEGPYTISPAISIGTQTEHTVLHWVYDAYEINITTPYMQVLPGILALTDYSFSALEKE